MANVDLGEMQSHVHTILSKIDEPLAFKYLKRKKSQLKRVNKLNGLKAYDQDRDFWDLKDIAGKKQCVIYGRAIYSYFADSYRGYKPHLNAIDVYDFLIDPAAGGLFLENAQYLGDYGVVYTRSELKAGIKSGEFLKTETERLIQGGSNATEQPQEVINQMNRTRDTNVWMTNKEITGSDKFKFWRWGTTFEGKRYYLLMTERGATAVKVELLKDRFASNMWWYWTYAAFPDLTEFWTPSFCDYVRELIMAKATSINQMLDNSEKINKPQRKIKAGSIENMSQLKYRREGNIIVKKDVDIDKAFQIVATPAITAPLVVFDKLDQIQQRSSGVTAGDKGDAENNSGAKATIYKGNQANSADLYGFFNKSYSFGYKSFSILYEHGVREHLIRKEAIDIMGPDGIELEEVSRRDIFRKGESFKTAVESSRAELILSEDERKQKLAFLDAKDKDPNSVQNKKKSYEIQAKTVGFDEEDIRQLLDTSEFGDEELMADADADIEAILDGEDIPPNPEANTAYKQRFVDYMKKNQATRLTQDEFMRLAAYVDKLGPIIIENTVRLANETLAAQAMRDALNPESAAVIAAGGDPNKQPIQPTGAMVDAPVVPNAMGSGPLQA